MGLSTPRSPERGTGSSWTPVRSVPGGRLGRTPALEMEDPLWSVRPRLGGGPWWVLSPGVLDVPHTCPGSTLIFISSEIGLIPTKISNVALVVIITTCYIYQESRMITFHFLNFSC